MWINIYISKISRRIFSDGQVFTSYNVAIDNKVKGFEYLKTCEIK